MNQVIAGIYGTGGHEKVASAGGESITTLDDLALLFLSEVGFDGSEGVEKIAAARDEVLNEFASFDQAGRALAHHEFEQMEKEASEGDTSALEAFFADLEVAESPADELRTKIAAEIARRTG